MTRVKKIPLSSFGPAIISLLRAGMQKEFDFPCKTAGEARYLMMRVHQLRHAMRESGNLEAEELYRCGVQRTGSVLHFKPRDIQFEEQLKKLNIPIGFDPEGTPAEPSPAPDNSDPAEDFLASLRRKDNE